MGDAGSGLCAPRRPPAEAPALAPPSSSAPAACVRLPTRFPSPDLASSDSGASFRPPPPASMVFASDGRRSDAHVATSADTLLALRRPVNPSELEGTVTLRKKPRVAVAGHHERVILERRQSVELSSSAEADAINTGNDSGAEEGATTASSVKSDEVESKPKKRPRRIRKHRKATHTVRKEEKAQLQKELDELNEKMIELQRRALNLTAESEDEQSIHEKTTSRNVLSHLLRRQQLEFATIRKLVSESTASVIRGGSPIQQSIHLKADLYSRRELLSSIKASKLKAGREFLHSRLPEVDFGAPMDEDFRFESPDGDFYACQFTIIQFECMHDARHVFDQLIYFLCNAEISISEKVGHLTIREDDDAAADGIAQNKIVSTTVHGVKMESNTVIFSQFYDCASSEAGSDPDGEYGVIVTDFVDLDDRHPYRPTERIRKDVSSVMEVRPFWRTRLDGQQEKVVVLMRWAHSRLRRPECVASRVAWLDLRDNMDVWSKNMHKVILESMTSAAPASASTTTLSIAPPPLFHQPRGFHAPPWS